MRLRVFILTVQWLLMMTLEVTQAVTLCSASDLSMTHWYSGNITVLMCGEWHFLFYYSFIQRLQIVLMWQWLMAIGWYYYKCIGDKYSDDRLQILPIPDTHSGDCAWCWWVFCDSDEQAVLFLLLLLWCSLVGLCVVDTHYLYWLNVVAVMCEEYNVFNVALFSVGWLLSRLYV